MSNIPGDLLYTKEHEWVKLNDDKTTAVMGITHHAQEQMGEVVFVELPEIDQEAAQGEQMGVVESVKTASDLFAAVSGTVVEVNKTLLQEIDGEENSDFHPEYVNNDPYGKGWLVKIALTDTSELDNLITPEDYEKLIS